MDITITSISPSPLRFALEPFFALCDYVVGHMEPADLSLPGDGHPVLVLPGLGVSGSATKDLRARITQLGYCVYDWKQGINNGHGLDLDRWLVSLGKQLQELQACHKCGISIIGWSLGGTYARALAQRHPGLVRQVITLATPFSLRESGERLPVPSTSIYSMADGIVSWEQCQGNEALGHRNIEVGNVSHFGMVHHPKILKVLAELLQDLAPPSKH